MIEENNNKETELNPSSDITINEGESSQIESSPAVSKEVPPESVDSTEAVEETLSGSEEGDRKVAKTYSPRTNGGGRKFQMQRNSRFKRRGCRFCQNKNIVIHYRNPEVLGRFITDRGKILPRRITGTCARHQRVLATSIKRARILALLPFVVK